MLRHPLIANARAATASGISLLLVLIAWSPLSSLAIEPGRHFVFQQSSVIGDLQCPVKNKTNLTPSPPNKEILEPPNAEELDELGILTTRLGTPAKQNSASASDKTQSAPVVTRPGSARSQATRVGIWGNSHLAAGSFSYELKRIFLAQGLKARTQFIPFTMGRAGVNLPLRRHCMDKWKSDLAFVARNTGIPTGVGLNVLNGETEAYLWFDLRNESGEADVSSVELFFHQAPGNGSISISVDDGPENKISLDGTQGFGSLTIIGNHPLSLLKIRVTEMPVQLNGMFLNYRQAPAATLDSFGIPGATVRAWQQLDPVYFSEYFKDRKYDLVMLEYGTNEGNAAPFDAVGYAKTLEQSLKNLRQVFPKSECLLIAPGDRGVLIPRSRKVKKPNKNKSAYAKKDKDGQKIKPRDRVTYEYSAVDLLRFSAIHEKISTIQKDVGARYSCKVWSMQTAMGGQGSSYAWLLANPALMSKDLTHFTIKGYQRLAQELASSLGWKNELGSPSVPPAEQTGDDGAPKQEPLPK
jgi:lysophospholipase L1-like esterase